jgi:hypothetical protein
LRQYKNENGYWPEHLEDIKDSLETDILVDPTNNGSFAYKLSDDSFRLYGKGKNNIDEEGEYDPCDEAGADDILIWPARSRRIEEEDANAE